MEQAIVSDSGIKDLRKYELLNQRLDDIMNGFNFNKFERLPLIFDKNTPTVTELGDFSCRLISTIGYCIRTSSKILIITYESQYHEVISGWSMICIRELNYIDDPNEFYLSDNINDNINNVKLYKFISKPYNRYCAMISQSSIKSAKQ